MSNKVASTRDFTVSHGWQYSDVTSTPWRLNSPVTGSVSKQLVQDNIKEHIKALHYWPLVWESTGHWWNPSQMAIDVESVSMLRLRYGITCFASAGLRRGPFSWMTTHVNDCLNGDSVYSVRFQVFDGNAIAIDLFCLKYWYVYYHLFHNKSLQKWTLFE